MFDKSKRKKFDEATVGDLIKFLENLPKKTRILFQGDSEGYIHMEEDMSAISFDDNNNLDYFYRYHEDRRR